MAVSASRRQVSGPYIPERHVASLRRAAIGLLGAVAALSFVAIMVAAALLVYGARHSGTIYSGARAAGVDLGGKTPAEAQALLDQRLNAYAQQPLTFTANGQTLQATPAELGLTFDAQAMSSRAYDFGRDSALWVDSRRWLDALVGGHTVPVVVSVDANRFGSFFAQRANGIAVAPRDAALTVGADGRAVIDPGQAGVALDLNATLRSFESRANSLSTQPVQIATVSVPPTVTDTKLQAALDQVSTLVDKPLTITLGGTAWQIDSAALRGMLRVDTAQGTPSVALDRKALRDYIGALEQDIFTSGVNAGIANNAGTFTTTAAVPGHKLDIAASTDAAMSALQNDQHEVALVTNPVPPQVSDADVAAALTTAQKLSSSDVALTFDGGTATVSAATLAQAVRFDTNPSRNPVIVVTFDQGAVQQSLDAVATAVKVDPKDADLRWIDGQVQVRTPEQNGRELDTPATLDGLNKALAGGQTSVAVVTKDVKPAVTAASAAGIQLPDLLGASQSYYGDSAANRYFNVELASSRINGAMVPPGGTFSFNTSVGSVTYESGYRTGFGIVAVSSGSAQTVPSVGGGICQVATTAFQASFRAGMPVVERNWHLYWIDRYGQEATGGMRALDATVDEQAGLDMKFKNTTNNWLAYKVIWDGANVRFELWGTNPGWDVQIDQPVISNVVPASQQMYYEQSSELPAGTSTLVEHAADGFDASIHRVVRKDGQVVDEITLNSSYVPSRNVTLTGTGG